MSVSNGDHREKVSTVPPKLPKAGSIILYQKQHPKDTSYLCDQYHRFMSKGSTVLSQYAIKKDYWKLAIPKDNIDGSLTTTNSRVEVNFFKHVFTFIQPDPAKIDIALIHYFGDDSLYTPNPHGNSKSDKPFIRTAKDSIVSLKSRVSETGAKPKSVYLHQVKEVHNDARKNEREVIFAARDEKQVKNLKQAQKNKRKISNCELFSIFEMAKQDMGEFILKMDLIPFQVIIFGEPSTLQLCNSLLTAAAKNNELNQLLCYDTTFELGDALVSILVARNTMVFGDPIFPVAFMIHERKVQEIHDLFWKTLTNKINFKCLEVNVPICVDREFALSNAVRKAVPNANVIFCSNHIRRDIREWIKRGNAKSDDYKIICTQIPLLMLTESEAEFEALYSRFAEKWSKDFCSYMNSCVKSDLRTCSAFNARRFAAFQENLPTNNLSESLNFVIKQFLDWKELPLDTLVLKLVELQCNHLVELHRGINQMGNYRLKNAYKTFEFQLPLYAWNNHHDISSSFKQMVTKSVALEEISQSVASNEVLAARCINMDFVSFVTKQRIWIVRSVFDNRLYTLERNEKKKNLELVCSCKKASMCYHKLAVMMSLGESYNPRDPKLQLSVLGKRSRKHGTKLGRKMPNVDDLADLIKAAADSKYALELKNATTFGEGTLKDFDSELMEDSTFENDQTSQERPILVSPLPEDSTKLRDSDLLFQTLSCDPLTSQELIEVGKFSKCLSGNTWLCGETIDKAIQSMLVESKNSSIFYVPEVYYSSLASKSHLHFLHYARNKEALSFDVIFVPVIQQNHWMLGVVVFKTKFVFLIDSFYEKTETKSRLPVYKNLLKIVALSHYAADEDVNINEWSLGYSSDSPVQNDGTECGVIVCLNAYALIKRESFFSSKFVSSVYLYRNRRWLLNLIRDSLFHDEAIHRNKRLSKKMQENSNQIIGDLESSSGFVIIRCECFRQISAAIKGNAIL